MTLVDTSFADGAKPAPTNDGLIAGPGSNGTVRTDCSDEPGDALYAEAKQFCYGFLAGVAQFHRSMVNGDGIKPIACPKQEVTRAQLATVFLDWAKANPQSNDELPAQSLSRAAAAKWPCKG
jgi:Rap1a immunity proteins